MTTAATPASAALTNEAPAATANHTLAAARGLSPSALISQATAAIAALVEPSVVVVGHRGGGGAGVIWEPDGLIVTNRHVARADELPVTLHDGRALTGRVIARHADRDLALIQIDAVGLPAARAGDSDQVRPGQLIHALGHPIGYQHAMTTGIVVAAGQRITEDGPEAGDWLQSDVTLLPGNSGGPLVDSSGAVIGISTMIAGQLSLGVPSNTVVAFVTAVRYPHTAAYLGLTGFVIDVPQAARGVGFMVTAVDPGSPAAHAGLLIGDIVVKVGPMPVRDQESLPAATLRLRPGTATTIGIIRAGTAQSVELTPAAPPAAS